MKFKAVLIDIDNTLLDFDAYVKSTLKNGFEHFGIGPYEDWMYDAFHEENDKLWKALERQEITFDYIKQNRFNAVFKRLGKSFDGPTFEKYFREGIYECAIPVQGARELLQYLHGKTLVCSASNGPYEQQLHRLEICGFSEFIDYNFISEGLGFSKPTVEFFDAALDMIARDANQRIMPQECLMIGDSLTSDIAGGINCGMTTCFFDKKGCGLPEGLAKEKTPDFVVKNLMDIVRLEGLGL